MNLPLPRWFDSLSEADQPAAKQRFLIRLAALHASDSGTVVALTAALGKSRNSLTRYIQPDPERITVQLAIDIENLVGRAVVRREDLLPEVFALPE